MMFHCMAPAQGLPRTFCFGSRNEKGTASSFALFPGFGSSLSNLSRFSSGNPGPRQTCSKARAKKRKKIPTRSPFDSSVAPLSTTWANFSIASSSSAQALMDRGDSWWSWTYGRCWLLWTPIDQWGIIGIHKKPCSTASSNFELRRLIVWCVWAPPKCHRQRAAGAASRFAQLHRLHLWASLRPQRQKPHSQHWHPHTVETWRCKTGCPPKDGYCYSNIMMMTVIVFIYLYIMIINMH